MRKSALKALFAFCMGVMLIAGSAAPARADWRWLPVPLNPQETKAWCWAASGEMVMAYLGYEVRQCVQANNHFGRNDCCNYAMCPHPDESSPCARGGWPEFWRYGFAYYVSDDGIAIPWEWLQTEINYNRPVAFSWYFNGGGGGHFMVVNGWSNDGGRNMVNARDPWTPCVGDTVWMTYEAYVSGQGYTHARDYYSIIYVGN